MYNNQLLSIYPIFETINEDYKIILKFITKCKDKNIKVIIFDWDLTVSKIHMYHKLNKLWGNNIDECKRSIESNLSNYLCYEKINMEKESKYTFFMFLYYLKMNHPECTVAIASFGMCDMIGFTLDELFKQSGLEGNRKEYIPNNFIFGGNYMPHEKHCKGFSEAIGNSVNKKNTQIQKLKEDLDIVHNNEILFIDDDNQNIISANSKFEGINTYNMPVTDNSNIDGFNIGNLKLILNNKNLFN